MTRDEFTKLFSNEMRARGYAISACYPKSIIFHHRSRCRDDKFVLRFEGHCESEWKASKYDDDLFFEFQVQDHETYNRDMDFDAYSTMIHYHIGKTEMKEFVDRVILAVDRYYD